MAQGRAAMKNITRFALGFASSLLLAAGLAQAADRLDPVRLETRSATDNAISSAPDCSTQYCNIIAAPDCSTQFCDIVDNGN